MRNTLGRAELTLIEGNVERQQTQGGHKLGIVVMTIIGVVIAVTAFSMLSFCSRGSSHRGASEDPKLEASLRAVLPNEDVETVYATNDGVAIVTLALPKSAYGPNAEKSAQLKAGIVFSNLPRVTRVEVYDSSRSQMGVFDPPLQGGRPAVPNKRIERTP